MDDTSLMSDHISNEDRKRIVTNNLKYQQFDPAYEHPPGITGEENDQEMNLYASLTLRKIEINKPETAAGVPKYLFKILSLLYT